MQLTFEEAIDLTSSENNPEPKNVNQLSIVHESQKGDITQYYITKESNQAGDKESTALSIYHAKNKTTPAYYTYNTYNSLVWKTKGGSRLTRQRITHLGLKAFPNVGAIAFYKLAYRKLSKIVAPVNYVTKKHKGPILSAEVLPTSIQFSITPPSSENTATEDLITYTCYRVNMQWNQFTLEYVSYDQVFRVPIPETTGTYSCWCFGYTDDGNVISEDSNTVDIYIQGTRTDWPDVTPGSEDIYINQLQFNEEGYLIGDLTNGAQIRSNNQVPFKLKELHDVDIAEETEHDLLKYNSTKDKWENYKIVNEVTVTLLSSAWDIDEHTVTITVEGVTTDSTQEILPLLATSQANIKNNTLLQEAIIMDAGQSKNKITLYAVNVPTKNLQVRVRVYA